MSDIFIWVQGEFCFAFQFQFHFHPPATTIHVFLKVRPSIYILMGQFQSSLIGLLQQVQLRFGRLSLIRSGFAVVTLQCTLVAAKPTATAFLFLPIYWLRLLLLCHIYVYIYIYLLRVRSKTTFFGGLLQWSWTILLDPVKFCFPKATEQTPF